MFAAMVKGIVGVVVVAGLAGGCAVGQQISYSSQIPQIRSPGAVSVAVAVQDTRDEVRMGMKPPNFCGLLRGGFGNPFNVTTASNRPLATDFGYVIGRGLAAGGVRTAWVATAPTLPDDVAVRAVVGQRADRALLITISDWKSDTYQNTALQYRLTARVLDGQGRVLAQNQVVGSENLGGSFFNPGGHAKQVVPIAYRRQLERLLNARQILQGLAGGAGAQAAPPQQPAPPPEQAPPSVQPAPSTPPAPLPGAAPAS